MSNQEVIKELKHLESVFSAMATNNKPLAERLDSGYFEGKLEAYTLALEHVRRRIQSLQGLSHG